MLSFDLLLPLTLLFQLFPVVPMWLLLQRLLLLPSPSYPVSYPALPLILWLHLLL